MPVIPLVGSASAEAPNPKRGTISSERIKIIANMMLARLDAIKDPLLVGVPMAGPLEILIGVLCKWPARILVRGKIVEALTEALPPDAKE